MSERFKLWWRGRSTREQRMLLVMFALIAIVLVWLAVLRPLSDLRADAERRHGEAVVALAEAKARAVAAGQVARPGAPLPLPIDSLLARTAADAGFPNARIVTQSPTQATITIEAGRPQAVLGWVRGLEAQGVAVGSLRARINQDRTIFVEAGFNAGPRP
ncbi:type II secretion system protein GspM [Sphingosinicella sp. LHD-64]|uniref:type II secretion system protein GspM n=1 Tax=Sphingosinicella sp. LHD-64 TaxID=3072139 RepID=UPI00280CD86F|nr:type II secretion system protein GspM [Sphingosinicella sp. LHD-64]MDQ8755662.1 type II secretion system protein GspM [Sphingosinicella sp. LHD-64]